MKSYLLNDILLGINVSRPIENDSATLLFCYTRGYNYLHEIKIHCISIHIMFCFT